jgi:hypothetical protein
MNTLEGTMKGVDQPLFESGVLVVEEQEQWALPMEARSWTASDMEGSPEKEVPFGHRHDHLAAKTLWLVFTVWVSLPF